DDAQEGTRSLQSLSSESLASATAKATDSPTGDDGIRLAAWVERVLDRVPVWMAKIVASGGDRWVRTAETAASCAATHSKDAISLRIWGGVADSLSNDLAALRSIRRIATIMDRQGDLSSPEQIGDENLLFERLAPLLALKRVPANLWIVRVSNRDMNIICCRAGIAKKTGNRDERR
ncbi:MAG: hypothetical protein AAGG44_21495, partial [Planctomycetota bacterium]